MQGPPPTSPSYSTAPPIKRQAVEGQPPVGGGPPPGGPPPTNNDTSTQRRAQLQTLRAGYSSRPTMGPPPARGTIPSIGFNPGAKAPAASSASNGGSNHSQTRPGIPERGPNFARQSDIFPSAPKAPATTPAVARRLDMAFPQPTPRMDNDPMKMMMNQNNNQTNAASTSTAPPPLATEPLTASSPPMAAPAKQVGFAPPATPATKGVTFAKSPPASPATPTPIMSPPQTPFPGNNSNSTAAAGHTPFPTKTTNGTAGHTPFPGKAVPTTPEESPAAAGAPATPYPTKGVQFAGQTPHPASAKNIDRQDPSSTNRRQKLAQMREVADTPPPKAAAGHNNNKSIVSFALTEDSVELRMQKQLTEETKKTEQLHRKVAELEDQLARAAAAKSADARGVSFMPPPSPSKPMDRLTPTRKRAATPHPKRDEGEIERVDQQFLEQATEDVPYKFEAGDDDQEEDGGNLEALFVVRRPYGFGDQDQELWFAAGEKNAKLYKRDATVDRIESIEVAVQIGADESVLLLYNEADVRHQNAIEGTWNKFGNFYERGDVLGTVAYIDVDANEKEYSLDKLVEQAIDVRKHYCASLRNMAIGLQRRAQEGGGNPLSPLAMQSHGSPMSSAPAQLSPKVDACVGTDPMKLPPADKSVPPPQQQPALTPPAVPQEPPSDAISLLIGMITSMLYFCFIKVPFKVVSTVIIWTLAAILVFVIYLVMLNTMGSTGVAPPLHYYHNPPGIM
eukprot:scaffold5198_cov173-Amphora_coffeaeformis.AAC.10